MLKVRPGTVEEAVDLARIMPDFANPYNLRDVDAKPPHLDHILIAEVDGAPVGFRAGYRHSADTFAIWLAAVLPDYRGRGIAGALEKAQRQWLLDSGYRLVRTHARNFNQRMLRILVDNGYQIVDVVRYPDASRNKIVFLKNLREGDAGIDALPLVVGLWKSRGPESDQDLERWLRDITISWLRFKYTGRVIEGTDINLILRQACESASKYCLILANGTIVSHAWELGLVRTITAWADAQDFLVAGRPLEQDGICQGVSPGGLLINLEQYQKLGRPEYSDRGTQSPAHRPPGASIVSASQAAGLSVRSLPDSISSTLLDIAPEHRAQAARLRAIRGEAIAAANLEREELSPGQHKFLTGVQRQVQNCRRGIFVWNFESYDNVNRPPANFQPPVSTIFSVAAGLKTSWILQTHGFDHRTRLVYFDYSAKALEFKKLLHESWDGEDYPGFLKYLFDKIEPGEAFYQLWGGYSPRDMNWETAKDAWEKETERWGGAQVIKENWRRVKELRIDYVLCDILDDQEPLLSRVEAGPGKLVWWSNVFFTFYSNWFHPIAARREIYERFIRGLTERNPAITIFGNDYNNIAIDGITAAEYAEAYFQTEENCLEPRKIRS